MERIAIFDLDGTLLDGRIWQAFVSHHFTHKVHRHEALKYLARNFGHFALYKARLVPRSAVWDRFGREIVTFVRGMDEARAQRVFDTIFAESIEPRLDPVLLQRWQAFGDEGVRRFIVSGSPAPILRTIGDHLGATATFGTTPELRNGRYTGRIVGLLCQDEEKARRLKEYIDEQGWQVDWAASFSFADSHADRPILELVGNPIAVRPDPKLLTHAQNEGWTVIGEPARQ
jgi:HAD superfamily hydrolase (TIGR01490 family)